MFGFTVIAGEVFCTDVQADVDACYATWPYIIGAGEIDIAAVEQHVLFEPSLREIGFLPDPLLDSEAGGWTSLVQMTEFDRDSILVA